MPRLPTALTAYPRAVAELVVGSVAAVFALAVIGVLWMYDRLTKRRRTHAEICNTRFGGDCDC